MGTRCSTAAAAQAVPPPAPPVPPAPPTPRQVLATRIAVACSAGDADGAQALLKEHGTDVDTALLGRKLRLAYTRNDTAWIRTFLRVADTVDTPLVDGTVCRWMDGTSVESSEAARLVIQGIASGNIPNWYDGQSLKRMVEDSMFEVSERAQFSRNDEAWAGVLMGRVRAMTPSLQREEFGWAGVFNQYDMIQDDKWEPIEWNDWVLRMLQTDMVRNISVAGDFQALFEYACAHPSENKRVLRFFAEAEGAMSVDVNAGGSQLFRHACAVGDTELVRLLLARKGTRCVNVNAANDEAFRKACHGGHIVIVEMLLAATGAQRVDVHAEDEDAFQGACGNPQACGVVCRLLVLTGDRRVNVHARNSLALARAHACGSAATVGLLMSLTGDRAWSARVDNQLDGRSVEVKAPMHDGSNDTPEASAPLPDVDASACGASVEATDTNK